MLDTLMDNGIHLPIIFPLAIFPKTQFVIVAFRSIPLQFEKNDVPVLMIVT